MAMQTMTSRWTPVVTLAMILGAAGCDDPLEPEEHAEAGGVVLLAAGSGTVLSRSIGASRRGRRRCANSRRTSRPCA